MSEQLVPEPEVAEKPRRRKFTATYKLRILRKADACCDSGQIGSLLRSEGLHSSNLSTWRTQREEGILQALAPKKRGRRPRQVEPNARRVTELERENEQLRRKLRQAETIIDVQKKLSQILGISQETASTGSD
jgi:transposase-like protein